MLFVSDDKVGKSYLCYKLVLATFWVCVICLDLTYNSLNSSSPRQGAKYLLYATRSGQIHQTFFCSLFQKAT